MSDDDAVIRQAIRDLRSEFSELHVDYTLNPGGVVFYIGKNYDNGFQISDFPDWEDVIRMRTWLESERANRR